MSMTNHTLGIWTCELSPFKDASVIPWPTGTQSWIVNFRAEVCRKTIGSCSRRDACSFLHTHATGDREDNVEWSGDTQEILTWSKHPLQYRKCNTHWRKSLNSLKASPVTKAEHSLSIAGKMKKYRRVIVVTSLETDAFMAIVSHIDMLKMRATSARGREEGTQEAVAIQTEDKVQGCVSQDSAPMNSILRKVGELGLNASAGHTRNSWDASGTKLNGQSGGIIQKSEPHERYPCAPSSEEQPEETSRQADCVSKVAWDLARKYASSSRTLNYVLFSCEGARDTEARMFVVEQGELSSDTMDTLRRFETHMRFTTTRDSANKRVSTSFRSWSRSVRNSAITRWNVRDSIVS